MRVKGISPVSDPIQQDTLTGIHRVACGEDAIEPQGLTSASVETEDVVVRSTPGEEEWGSCLAHLVKDSIEPPMSDNYCMNDGRLTLPTSRARGN